MLKKLLLLSSFIISCNGMEFDPRINRSVQEGVKKIVEIGSEMEDHKQNGIITIYKEMAQEIEETGSISLNHEGTQLKQELTADVINNRGYQTALEIALEKTAEMTRAWDSFRKTAAHILTDNVELTTSMRFNRNPHDLPGFLNLNKELDPLQDAQTVRVALLLLYSFQQAQLRSIEEQLFFLEKKK